MASSMVHKAFLIPAILVAIVILFATAVAIQRPTSTVPLDLGLSRPAAATSVVDIPVAPDYAFLPTTSQTDVTASDAVAIARKSAPPGFVGSRAVVRLLLVKEGRRDYGPLLVVVSADAAPIVPFGDGAPGLSATPVVATYGWVFLTPSGEIVGASREGYTSQPPLVPDE